MTEVLLNSPNRPYINEDDLQRLIEDNPILIPGHQIDRYEPRSWLLVEREAGVPKEEDGARNWSLDHLFLDQDGVPTLVEVKRSSDTRIRREVIGQILDYAANALLYWPVESILAKLEQRCAKESKVVAEELQAAFGLSVDSEDYWKKVKTNLQAGRVRMLIVADAIPTELLTVVEFLNEQMDPAEIFALEIRQFVSGDTRSLVPRLLGQSTQAQQKKSGGSQGAEALERSSIL